MVWRVGAETSNDLSLPGTESQQATDLLGSRFPPQQTGSSPFVFHVSRGKITDSANKQAVEASYKALFKAPHVASAPGPFANAASGLVSKDGTTAFTPSSWTSPMVTSPRSSPTPSSPSPPRRRRRASRSPSGATSAGSCPARPTRAAVLLAAAMVLSLAPALLTLFGAGVWWLRRRLDRVLPHVNIEGEDEPAPERSLDLQPWPAKTEPAPPDGDGTPAGQPTGQAGPGKDGSGT